MSNAELGWMSATTMAAEVAAGALSPSDIAAEMIERVEQVNPEINAIVDFDADQVRRDAAALTEQQRSGDPLGPLHGVPFTIKDLTAVAGRPLTFGMKPLRDNIADHDAVIVQRLRAAGGLFLGKTNTPESGYYGGTDNHLFGPTHNPWKHGYSAGGSSGGAAAAVAAGLGPLAEGSDGAGSVRIPASLCGVVGMKPTTGTVPQTILAGRYYNWAYHGPITRTVADNALMLEVIAGADHADPLSNPRPAESYVDAMRGDIRGLRVAWSPDMGLGQHVEPEVARVCQEALAAFSELGAEVTEASPNWSGTSVAMWHGVWVPGFASEYDLVDWQGSRGQVDDGLIGIMEAAEKLTGVDVGRADVVRGAMWDSWTRFMDDYDVLVSPTLASATFPLSQFAPEWLEGASLREQILDWLLTYPYNMLNNPAITVPAGFTADGRPVGLQIAARHRQEGLLLRVAANFEAARPWAQQRPSV